MTTLKLGEGLHVPIEIAGQAVALVGIRGSGKTNSAGVIAEELLDRGQPIVVLDPTDAWWGLRSKYPVIIFGGPHGDLPLTETDGHTLAEFIVDEKVPIILSLRHLRKGAQRRLVTEFCEELFHLKGKPEYREPLTVFIDEAPQFVPQRVMGEMARLVGAVQDMILLGRNVGFGVVLISQRFATLNADIRTQADTIIVHRLPSPLDRKALTDWIEENATMAEQKVVLASLAVLKTGEAWVWSPYFDLFKRAQIRARKTFDSSAAPKRGVSPKAPSALKTVDLDKLKAKLAATLERVQQDDPVALRRQIADLKAAGAQAPPQTVERPVLNEAELARLEKGIDRMSVTAGMVQQAAQALVTLGTALIDGMGWVRRIANTPIYTPPATEGRIARKDVLFGKMTEITLTPAKQKILNGLAFLAKIGHPHAEKTQLALIAGVSSTSGGYFNNLGALRSAGLIDYPQPGVITLTETGYDAASLAHIPTTTRELHEALRDRLPAAKWKILEVLIGTYPRPMSKEDLARRLDVSPTSGGYFNNLGSLRTMGLIDYPYPGAVVARSQLFLGKDVPA